MTLKSSTTIELADDLLQLVDPGEILLEEFLKPLDLSQYRLAKELNVPPRRINEIVHGVWAITADTALRLGRYFATSPQFWLNLQVQYDLRREQRRAGQRIEAEVRPRQEAQAG